MKQAFLALGEKSSSAALLGGSLNINRFMERLARRHAFLFAGGKIEIEETGRGKDALVREAYEFAALNQDHPLAERIKSKARALSSEKISDAASTLELSMLLSKASTPAAPQG